jgi:hypothetical protein
MERRSWWQTWTASLGRACSQFFTSWLILVSFVEACCKGRLRTVYVLVWFLFSGVPISTYMCA